MLSEAYGFLLVIALAGAPALLAVWNNHIEKREREEEEE